MSGIGWRHEIRLASDDRRNDPGPDHGLDEGANAEEADEPRSDPSISS
jgi:hypothetical protein